MVVTIDSEVSKKKKKILQQDSRVEKMSRLKEMNGCMRQFILFSDSPGPQGILGPIPVYFSLAEN